MDRPVLFGEEEMQLLSEYQLTLIPKTVDDAEPVAKAILEQTLAQGGAIPNMYSRMANSPAMLDAYIHGSVAFRTQTGFSPVEQDVILITISRENGCEYCMAAHSSIADNKSGVPAEVTDALRNGESLPDGKLQALSQFTSAMSAKRGLPSRAEVASFLAAGYSERDVLDIILAISVKTISNYANHLFHTPVDEFFKGRSWADPSPGN